MLKWILKFHFSTFINNYFSLFTIGNAIRPDNNTPYTIELLIISLIKILLVIKLVINSINSENIAINLNFSLSLFFIGLLG
ncbi:MAG: hypothetical protein UT03_C0046G0002 [Candidatus Moranbacteria bacterium GW2011_GWD2_38_7]|nr:MAG: hypothetical protein UT03_C0046G0002 [Candidatus Moranbacteria bacterium GW2011_GWD2_38_7]